MSAPVVSFEQRNNFTRLELKLHPDYVEYYVAGMRGTNTGFNVKYELLPKEFDYRSFRQKDMFVLFPLVLIAALTPFQLLTGKSDPFFTIVFMLLYGVVLCGIGYGLRRLLKKEYTALATQVGILLIVKDDKHDQIVQQLQARRAAALKRAVTINRLEPPWSEVKKFKWLRDEGIISEADFKMYREAVLSSANAEPENAIAIPALH